MTQELGEVTANHEYELTLGKATYLDCFRGTLGWRLLTGCSLQGEYPICGSCSMLTWSSPTATYWRQLRTFDVCTMINSNHDQIFYYGTTYFSSTGIAGFTTQMVCRTRDTDASC